MKQVRRLFPAGLFAVVAAGAVFFQLSSAALSESLFETSPAEKDAALAARVPPAIQKKGILTIGSDTSYPPAEFLGGDDGQTPQGIDVDLAKAIAGKLGLKMEFLTASFEGILPAIGPRYDLGISAFSITNARYRAVDFVSYFNAGKQWAVQAGNPSKFNPAEPCGATVGVQTGSTAEKEAQTYSDACVKAGKKKIEFVSMSKQTDLVTRLINGAVDAVFAGSTNIGYAAKQTKGQIETIGAITAAGPNGIAIAKGETAWAQLIADTLNVLIADGTYEKILDKWGVRGASLQKAEVNPKVAI